MHMTVHHARHHSAAIHIDHFAVAVFIFHGAVLITHVFYDAVPDNYSFRFRIVLIHSINCRIFDDDVRRFLLLSSACCQRQYHAH